LNDFFRKIEKSPLFSRKRHGIFTPFLLEKYLCEIYIITKGISFYISGGIMGGFFGVVSREDCVADLFYGTDYHSHLGTKRGGMAVMDEAGRISRRIHDISNAQFRSKFDDDISKFAGKAGVGIISDYEDQPLVIVSR
jgi:hypothetical protein